MPHLGNGRIITLWGHPQDHIALLAPHQLRQAVVDRLGARKVVLVKTGFAHSALGVEGRL
jgi:hypothetical protein